MKSKYQAVFFLVSIAMLSACDSGSGSGTETIIQQVTRNYQPVFASVAPDIAQINLAYNYNFTALDFDAGPQPLSVGVNTADTCGGTLTDNGDGTGNYIFTPATAQLGTQCVVGLTASDSAAMTDQNTTVDISDENAAPYFTSTATTTATEGVLYTYNIAVADDNVPAQALTITRGLLDTCDGTVTDNGDGSGTYTITPGENDGGTTCLLSLNVTDSMSASADQYTVITIAETNSAPSFTSSAPTTASEGILYLYTATVTDPDYPDQTLTCSINGSDTCGGALVGCTYSFTSSEAQGGTNCTVGLRVTDNGSPALFTGQNTTVAVAEDNESPAWSTAPTSIIVLLGATYNSVNGVAVDSDDFPAQTLTCSKVGADTCAGFDVTVTGSGTSPVSCNLSFTAGASPETCSVDVQVDDGNGGTITSVVPITVAKCVVYVDDSAMGANNGSSWANAYTVLQTGVDAAALGACDVWVAVGYYKRPAAGNGSVLSMADGINIYGGFAGTETTLLERGDPLDFPTLLAGENLSYHVVIGANDATLDGFYVISGNANGSDPDWYGGGMYNLSKLNLTVNNCLFRGNSAYWYGGGMYNRDSSPIITNCTFSGNSATYGSGGGGGMSNINSSPIITNCTFSGNSSTGNGGGISNSNSSPTITNCLFLGNHSHRSGGIYNGDSSSPTITNCLFSGNHALNDLTAFGGGMSNINSSPIVINCTFSGNSSTGNGGGMINSSSSPTITNSIMWDDTAGTGVPEISNFSSSTTVSYSDISGGCAATGSICGAGNINSDPLFLEGIFGNYYLNQATSPCVNTGDPASSSPGGTTSILGVPDAGIVDMGYHYPIQ